MRRLWSALGLLVVLTARPPDHLTAQQPSVASPARPTAPADTAAKRATARPPRDTSHVVKPAGALWRSLLVPGWGQAVTGRYVAGAAFVVWEGTTMMMTLRAVQEKKYLQVTGSDNVAAKNQQIQDWAVLWGFNHLFAGAEAYVAAHLQDFPKELQFQAIPRGLAVTVTF